jgi:hypothetical protein
MHAPTTDCLHSTKSKTLSCELLSPSGPMSTLNTKFGSDLYKRTYSHVNTMYPPSLPLSCHPILQAIVVLPHVLRHNAA